MTSYDQHDQDIIWDWVELPGGHAGTDKPRAPDFACRARPYPADAPSAPAARRMERKGLFLGLGLALIVLLGSSAWWTLPRQQPGCAALSSYAQGETHAWILAQRRGTGIPA